MLKVRAEYEPFTWWLTRERIGQDLRGRYAVAQEVPPRLLALVRKLGDAVEGDQSREVLSPGAPPLPSKLDAVEGNQLLRACRDTSARPRLIYVKVLGVIAFLLATTVAVMAEMIPLPRARPIGIPGDPSTIGAEAAVSPCRSRLAEIAAFKPLPSITGPGDCTATDVVALDAVLLADGHRIALSPTATLRCPMAEAVTHWIRDDVAPTIADLGKSLRGVETLDSFDCRRRNGITDAKISEHGRANALDVRAFKLTNGAAIELTDASVAKSLREKLRQSACARFSTVLGNGADAYHDSHVHLDLLERSNQYRICQWDVLDFAETAALAAKKAAATASNPAVVKVSEIPLPRPRPVLLSDRPRNRSVRLGEAARHPLFNLFAPLLRGIH